MILGLGVDPIDLERFGSARDRFGVRPETRRLMPGQQRRVQRRTRGGECLAVRFAAKATTRCAGVAPVVREDDS